MAFSASRRTPRDPLPLPLVANAGGASGTLPGCRATRQGHGRRAAASADMNRCIEALNEMYAAGRPLGRVDVPDVDTQPSAIQQKCLTHIRESVRHLGALPSGLLPQKLYASFAFSGRTTRSRAPELRSTPRACLFQTWGAHRSPWPSCGARAGRKPSNASFPIRCCQATRLRRAYSCCRTPRRVLGPCIRQSENLGGIRHGAGPKRFDRF